MTCPATREAVWEREEEEGDVGCPLCGLSAEMHPAEAVEPWTPAERDELEGLIGP
jgi:hypothetical protein